MGNFRATDMLDAAEDLIRRVGFDGFSIRQIAEATGVRTASVHYHFPTKADLGAAVTLRYADRFEETLGDAARFLDGGDPVAHFAGAVVSRYDPEHRICLTGMLGAGVCALPEPVAEQMRRCFERNLCWLQSALMAGGMGADLARRRAVHVIAALQGGMILAAATRQRGRLDDVVAALVSMG